ncbi:MAG: peptidoglycan-binding protein [Candidatus Pacebacteria bacterium]|nr:peptidoglycan-binding protein [Candidatus Paceibacterota bacterium]
MKKYSILFNSIIRVCLIILIIVLPFLKSSQVNATTWHANFTDNFNRADNTSMGNSWDEGPGTHSISSNRLLLNTAGNPWVEGITMRPGGESSVDQRMTLEIPAGVDISGSALWTSLRTHSKGTEYLLGTDHSAVRFGKSVGGSLGFLSDSVAYSSYDSSHGYLIDVSVVGTSPTTLTIIVTDQNTSTVVASETMTDSTAELQSAGSAGFFTVGSITLDNVIVYDTNVPAATAYTFTGPTAGQINTATTNYTITPDGTYTGTITPSDSGAGGTFTPSSLTFSGGSAAQTFTYTPASTGTKTLSVSASPALGTNPAPISVVVTTLAPGVVSITDSNLVWSPYNWNFNGSTHAQTTAGGAYVKVGFTGSTLALGVSTAGNGAVDLSTIEVNAYIDGSGVPVSKTLADVSGGILTFSSALSAGNHYAIIYLSKSVEGTDRWVGPTNIIRITKIQLATDGTGASRSLSSTPLAQKSKKIVIFGDSITEGVGVDEAENGYAAVLGRTLEVEYGQVGYGAVGWDVGGNGGVPAFYESGTPANSSWRKHDSSTSRLVNNASLASGFTDGIPNAVFLNMGTNDYLNTTSAPNMRTKVTSWLTDIRTTVGASPAVFVISPFRFGNVDTATYKTALLGGISDYQALYPDDTRVYTLDLGSDGYDTTQAHGGLHPDATGSQLLAADLATLSEDYIIVPVSTASSVSGGTPNDSGTTITWTTDAPASSIVDYGLTTSYTASTTETDNATLTRTTSHSVALSGLVACTKYHYRVRSRDLVPNTASSADGNFTTTGCTGSASITSSESQAISGNGTFASGDLSLTVPAGFKIGTTEALFQANIIDETAFTLSAGTPTGKTLVGTYVVEIKALATDATTSISTFDTPLTVTITYDPLDLGALSESRLVIYRYDVGDGWTALTNCSINTTLHTVSCQTSHFSDFAIFSEVYTPPSGGGSTGSSGGLYLANTPYLMAANTPRFTPAPNTSNVSYKYNLGSVTLRKGSTGEAVKELQRFLNKSLDMKLAIDGKLGPKTIAVIKSWQKNNGLVVDGLIGPKTKAKINQLE